jgi:hypothetical protein
MPTDVDPARRYVHHSSFFDRSRGWAATFEKFGLVARVDDETGQSDQDVQHAASGDIEEDVGKTLERLSVGENLSIGRDDVSMNGREDVSIGRDDVSIGREDVSMGGGDDENRPDGTELMEDTDDLPGHDGSDLQPLVSRHVHGE